MDVRVCLIDAFDGPRHDRLRLIWKYFAEDVRGRANVVVYPNKGIPLRHGQMLEKIWGERKRWAERFVIFTEFDFLPSKTQFFVPLDEITPNEPIIAAEYVTRCPDTLKLQHHGKAGAWYIGIDRKHVHDLTFDHQPDPANNVPSPKLLTNRDGRPEHYGTELLPGSHLFFSRHYNDTEDMRIAGLSLFDILRGVDRRISNYIKNEM